MTVHEQLERAIAHKSNECERGVIAVAEVSSECAFGFALVAPDCILFSEQVGIFIFDVCLN
jgi:hypothetical protein